MTDESSSASGKQKLFTYTGMLLVGLMISQAAAGHLSVTQYSMYGRVVGLLTMFSLSFLMVGVGHEFVIERSKLGTYARDYIVAMSAAGLPWIFVALWLHFALPNSGLAWGSALLMARFAAPTSAGILFNMLEAAGFKETWLFKKAQVLAIFDDLDTILLMIPLKMYLVGFKWELSIDAVFVTTCLLLAWQNLHQIRLQSSWRWTMMYSALITAACEGLCFYTSGRVHIEVLLPAFVIGVIAISLGLGMQGPAVAVAVLSLAANLVLSTGFIMAIDRLMRKQLPGTAEPTGKPSGAAALSRKQLKRQPGYLVNGAARGLRGQNVRGAYAGLAPLRVSCTFAADQVASVASLPDMAMKAVNEQCKAALTLLRSCSKAEEEKLGKRHCAEKILFVQEQLRCCREKIEATKVTEASIEGLKQAEKELQSCAQKFGVKLKPPKGLFPRGLQQFQYFHAVDAASADQGRCKTSSALEPSGL
ncbi:unnamed protein product [Durusdinium trenchii]|uniref:Cation/H+ exchanger domain-containing protein n=1 Tax=Durusdinium trenchii TaxID=1381693 RepID=A0ABP0KDK7_9DINO